MKGEVEGMKGEVEQEVEEGEWGRSTSPRNERREEKRKGRVR